MKKSILKLGYALNKSELQKINGGSLCIDECGPGHPGNAGCEHPRICMQFSCYGDGSSVYYCVNQTPFGGKER